MTTILPKTQSVKLPDIYDRKLFGSPKGAKTTWKDVKMLDGPVKANITYQQYYD